MANSQGLIWAKQFGGEGGSSQALSIAIDYNGDIYTTGIFSGTVDFDPNAGTYLLSPLASSDIFVSKLDAAGNFIWAKKIGGGVGSSYEYSTSIAVDADKNVYITGYFYATSDFDPGVDTFNLTSNGAYDIFVLKLNASGDFAWVKQFGGTQSGDLGNAITIDTNAITGGVYATGRFLNTVDFDPGPGTYNLTSLASGLSPDMYIVKLDTAGNFIWAVQLGGVLGVDEPFSITTDASGNVYTTGKFEGAADFDPGPSTFSLSSMGGTNVFVSKLNSSGNFIWAKCLGSTVVPTTEDIGYSIAVDANQNVYTTGFFEGLSDFDPGSGLFNMSPVGVSDIFVSKLNNAGNFLWAKRIGSGNASGSENSFAIALDNTPNGGLYTTGWFTGTVDFDPNAGIYNLSYIWNEDIFVSKLDSSGSFIWADHFGGSQIEIGKSIAVSPGGDVYVTGYFRGTVDFDPGPGVVNLTANIGYNAFITKLGTITALNEKSNSSNSVFLSPNPATDELVVRGSEFGDKAEIEIYNVLGEKCLTPTLSKGEGIRVDVSSLPAGIYFLKVKGEKEERVAKFVKQ